MSDHNGLPLCLSVSYLHERAAVGVSSPPGNSLAQTIPFSGLLQDQGNEYEQLFHNIKEDATEQVWIIAH